ncbi:hypothetical protein ANCCAN_13751 [Ancylostoma caninum]|uniref:C2 NT-type domain-containing protein n=1 Tax=Ancylostoma caninum TaxID=29170 RepID=A0A368GC10_ANCCA|nr:hypothetical protein ANCCAN_13751 [Ancylostoma caninum]
MWPEQAPEHIDILTTLYKSQNDDQYDDKEWTIVVEEVTSKGRRKPIAAVPLNMRLFIMDHPDQSRDDVSLASTGSHADRSSREQSVCDVVNSHPPEEQTDNGGEDFYF